MVQSFTFLKESAHIARHHHERQDGKGYPDGLTGEELILSEKILIVADAYDALTSRRAYREHLTPKEIKEELIKNSGTQFDPKVIEVLLGML